MQFDTIITLISQEISEEITDTGQPIFLETKHYVYATTGGVKRNEFYQAQSLGLRPEITFLINMYDYNGEKIALYNEKKYNIIRSYPVKSEMLELICNDLAEVL